MARQTEIPTLCRMCDHGCGILVTVENGKPVHVRGNPDHPFNKGWICVKGKSCLDLFYAANRLKTPLIRSGSRLLETSLGTKRSVMPPKNSAGLKKNGVQRPWESTTVKGWDIRKSAFT